MPSGYVRVWEPDHPLANKDGHVLEHRKVLYDAGIDPRGKHVHHRNEDKADNRIENLEVKTPRAHSRGHIADRGDVVENQFGTFPVRAKKQCEQCEQCGKPFLPWTARTRFCSIPCANSRARPGRPPRSECGRGHKMAGANLLVTPKGARICRTCARRRQAEFKERRRAQK